MSSPQGLVGTVESGVLGLTAAGTAAEAPTVQSISAPALETDVREIYVFHAHHTAKSALA